MIPHIYNGNDTISLMIDGVMKPVDTAHKFYDEIKQALIEKNWDAIPDLVNIKIQVEKAINEGTARGLVVIQDGEVFYNQKRIHNSLTDRIISMAKEGFDIGHMVQFLENLMDNPSYRAVNELYDFLEAGAIPITENGTFLAYKKINEDWTDIHSGKFDNSVGTIVKMPRNEVDEDSTVTCSRGLHVCAYGYLPSYGWAEGCRVVICEVNPRDVCAIPKDYNNTKMRVCEYVVVGEVSDYKSGDSLSSKTVIKTTDVTHGKTEGTVDHTDYKQIGKDFTNMLERLDVLGKIDTEELCEDLVGAGLDEECFYIMQDIILDGDFKRAGKKLAYYIRSGEMLDPELFVDNMTAAIRTLADTEAEACSCSGSCPGCDGKCGCGCPSDCDTTAVKEAKRTCARCSATLEGNAEECAVCGFYNH